MRYSEERDREYRREQRLVALAIVFAGISAFAALMSIITL